MPNIQENITRIQGAKSSLKTSIQNKGVTIPDEALIDTYYTYVDQIQTGSSSGSAEYDSTMEDKHFTVNNDNGWPSLYTSATITDGITSLPVSAFANTPIIEIEIADSVTSLGSACFRSCKALSSITIPSGVTELPNNCFSGCSMLTSITIPDSVTSLGSHCFDNCYSLTSITIPSGVTSLEYGCFANCKFLSSITIPDSVTEINGECFFKCQSLSSVTIPDSVTKIGNDCFSYCRSLTSITCLPTVPPTSGGSMFGYIYNFSIYVPNESVDAYKQAWTTYADRIFPINPEPTPTGSTDNADIDVVYDVTSSTNPTKLFTSGQSIDYYTIDDDSTQHEPTSTEYTFDTTGDHTVHYHLTGDTIGEKMLYNQGFVLGEIKDITINSGVTNIGNYAFYNCYYITSMTISDSVISIGNYALFNCFSDEGEFVNLTIPDSVTNLGEACLSTNTFLRYLTIGTGITSIPTYCFSATSVSSFTIPDSVTSVSGSAFSYCRATKSVTFGTGLTQLDNCFHQMNSLEWIAFLGTTPPTLTLSSVLSDTNTNNCNIYVPDNSVDAYKTADKWMNIADRIQPLSSKPE